MLGFRNCFQTDLMVNGSKRNVVNIVGRQIDEQAEVGNPLLTTDFVVSGKVVVSEYAELIH